MTNELQGKAVLVVGASSGIGRAIASTLVGRGARVAFCARRKEALDKAVAEAGGGVVVTGDVRAAGDCDLIAERAARELGTLDAVVYAAAVSPLRMLADTTADDWRRVFDTNVTGAALVARGAIPHLVPGGVVAFLSSESVGRPRHGLVAYGASKLALEETIRGFRVEHSGHRFAKITVGATGGTEFGLEFDPEIAARLFPVWVGQGQMHVQLMEPEDLAAVIVDHLASAIAHPGVDVQEIVIRPPGELMTDPAEMLAMFEEYTAEIAEAEE